MRIRRSLKLLLIPTLIGLAAGRTAESAADPRALIEAGAHAMGGLDLLRRLPAVRVEETGHEYMISTPTSPDGPRRMALQTFTEIRNRSLDAIRWSQVLRYPMRPEVFNRTIVATATAGATMSGPRVAPDSPAGWRAARGEVELAPERILLTALAAAQLTLEPAIVVAGDSASVVRFPYREGSVELALDRRSHLPIRVMLTYSPADDPFMHMLGDATLETTWTAWAVDSSGLWYPRQRSVTLNGEPYREYVVTSFELPAAAPPDSFAIPDTVAARFSPSRSGPRSVRLSPRPLGRNAVLYLGGYQAFAVKQDDGVVVVEAPESAEKSRAVLRDLAERWPTVPVKALIATSPMWMHLGGVREYVARRIPIYASRGTAEVVRRLVAAPHRLSPDSLSRAPRSLRLHVVGGRLELGRRADRLEVRPADGPHGAAMLLVRLPALRLLYASDIPVPDAFEPNFKAAYRAELLRTVDGLSAAIDSVFGLHVAPMGVDAIRAGTPIEAARPSG